MMQWLRWRGSLQGVHRRLKGRRFKLEAILLKMVDHFFFFFGYRKLVSWRQVS